MDRVAKFAGTLVIPEPVKAEILGSHHNDAAARWLQGKGLSLVRPAVIETSALSGSAIGDGERSVISWAVAHKDFVAVLDDREARIIAQRLGVKVLGTVGVVLRLKSAGLIAEVKPHLSKIRQVGGFVSDELFHEALRCAGEQP